MALYYLLSDPESHGIALSLYQDYQDKQRHHINLFIFILSGNYHKDSVNVAGLVLRFY